MRPVFEPNPTASRGLADEILVTELVVNSATGYAGTVHLVMVNWETTVLVAPALLSNSISLQIKARLEDQLVTLRMLISAGKTKYWQY
jgi:hypothetical protein